MEIMNYVTGEYVALAVIAFVAGAFARPYLEKGLDKLKELKDKF